MALGTSALLGLAAAAGSAGLSYYNNRQMANRADNEAVRGIESNRRVQRGVDARVNEEVQNLERSTAADERAERLANYLQTVQSVKRRTNAGLDDAGAFGDDFVAAADVAKTDLAQQGATRANLMAGIDAPGLQRQGEAFRAGRLGSDIDAARRQSEGIDHMTRLRTSAIRPNGGMTALASLLGGVSSGLAGGGSAAAGGASAVSDLTNDDLVAMMRWGMGGT
jgi:hypothetical protein